MSKLNPCPLCGSEPDIESNGGYTSVYCVLCVDGFTITSESAIGAINAWNAATGGEQAAPTEKTLRDEFAMAALPMFSEVASGGDYFGEEAAMYAYFVADAMLKERNK